MNGCRAVSSITTAMNSMYLVIRVLHVLSAALWVGVALFSSLFLTPAAQDLGPDGMKMMAALRKRGFVAYVPVIATISLLSGVWLFWRFTAGFSPEVSRSRAGMAFSLGAACGLVAFILSGAVLSVSLSKAVRLSAEAAGLKDGPDKAGRLARAAALRQRAAVAGQIVSVLLLAATAAMALARYF
jgi:uncharacterized membrane protein